MRMGWLYDPVRPLDKRERLSKQDGTKTYARAPKRPIISVT